MHRALVFDHLERAERHIVAGRKQIADQIEFIAWLTWFRSDTMGAKALLREFERDLARHIADRERLRAQLAHLDRITASRGQAARHPPTETGIPRLQSAV